MTEMSYLPLGSIVLMKDGTHRVMITGRALHVKQNDEVYFFDYAGVLYPEGVTGQEICYFNNDWIEEVNFFGFNDEANRRYVSVIENYVNSQTELKRCPRPEPEKNEEQ